MQTKKKIKNLRKSNIKKVESTIAWCLCIKFIIKLIVQELSVATEAAISIWPLSNLFVNLVSLNLEMVWEGYNCMPVIEKDSSRLESELEPNRKGLEYFYMAWDAELFIGTISIPQATAPPPCKMIKFVTIVTFNLRNHFSPFFSSFFLRIMSS